MGAKENKKSVSTKPVPRKPISKKTTTLKVVSNASGRLFRMKQERLAINLNLASLMKTSEEAFLIHLIIYWNLKNERYKKIQYLKNGKYWTYFSVREIHDNYLGCITETKIKAAIKRLTRGNYIHIDQFGPMFNRSKWYRANFDELTKHGFSKNTMCEFYGVTLKL